MKLASDQMEGEEFELNPKNFIAGQEFKATKEVANVGDISNIQLRQADDDNGPFTCKKITITQDASSWEFECNDILDKNQKVMIMNL